jgi:hypothetical protein
MGLEMSEKRMDVFREIIIVLVLGLVSVSFLSAKTVNAQAGQATLRPTDDTFVDSNNTSSNYGGQNYLQIENWQNAQIYDYKSMVWLKFNLSSVPDGAVVDDATLQLYPPIVDETFNVRAYSCPDNSWTELTLTYSNMPAYNTTAMDSVQVGNHHQWYNWTVIDAVRDAFNSTVKTFTIVLFDPSPHNSTTNVRFDSKENPVYFTDYSPKLTIHWNDVVPEFPTFLILPFFMTVTLLAVIIYGKRNAKTLRSP